MLTEIAPFYQAMYFKNFDKDYAYLSQEILKVKEQEPSVQYSNSGGWQSQMFGKINTAGYIHPWMDPLLSDIKQLLTPVYADFGFTFTPNISYWFNVNGNGHSNVSHKHPDSFMAGCFYVRVPEDSGNITFHREDLVGAFQVPTKRNSREFVIEPKQNLFVSWGGMMPHSVGVNNSNEDRISIAFNFN